MIFSLIELDFSKKLMRTYMSSLISSGLLVVRDGDPNISYFLLMSRNRMSTSKSPFLSPDKLMISLARYSRIIPE